MLSSWFAIEEPGLGELKPGNIYRISNIVQSGYHWKLSQHQPKDNFVFCAVGLSLRNLNSHQVLFQATD